MFQVAIIAKLNYQFNFVYTKKIMAKKKKAAKKTKKAKKTTKKRA